MAPSSLVSSRRTLVVAAAHVYSMLLLRHAVYIRSFGTLFLPFPHCVHCVCLCGLAPLGEGPPNPRASAASERGPTVVRGAGHRWVPHCDIRGRASGVLLGGGRAVPATGGAGVCDGPSQGWCGEATWVNRDPVGAVFALVAFSVCLTRMGRGPVPCRVCFLTTAWLRTLYDCSFLLRT